MMLLTGAEGCLYTFTRASGETIINQSITSYQLSEEVHGVDISGVPIPYITVYEYIV